MHMLADTIRDRSLHGQLPRPVLIVDDDELELCLLADRLSAAGYDVATAHSGDQARRLLEVRSFPVVITDYQMPGMDGLQLVEQMRSQPSIESYFIVWSIRAEESDREYGFTRGVDDYVSKQSSDSELLSRIETGFDTMKMRRALTRTAHVSSRPMPEAWALEDDAWGSGATRLHSEILRAQRYDRPLSVLMLHVERELSHVACTPDPDSDPGPDLVQDLQRLDCLKSAIGGTLRHSIDWVASLDGPEGLARFMLVLPETDVRHIPVILSRLYSALSHSVVTDELDKLMPECSVGVASVEYWPKDQPLNAASLVAAAERHMDKLSRFQTH